MFRFSFLILCFTHVCLPATNYDIIWDQNYCNEKDRYNNYLLPHNSPCSFCFGDVITLHINSTSVTYENLYRVPTATDMINCNATVNDNTQSIVFNNKREITIRAGGSEAALSFQLQPDAYYFISTSNGTQFSADNDVIQSPNSCLQLAFTVLLDNNAGCGNYTANCVFNSVFTDPSSSLFCPLPTTTPMITIAPTTITPTATNSSSMNDTTQSAVAIPLLILYALGKIGCDCNTLKFKHLSEPSSPISPVTNLRSSLDGMSQSNEYDLQGKPQDKIDNELYIPPHQPDDA
ncbi:hypothetical protein LOD99_8870 [Oopsacas minuta]|uniref:Uncharacterized protein n=1 Tax=Oopsacas minuta TaxID=111878 RepID=A0AAV7JFC2_9METZ|nr:hypothetical protein LOD99_8870 [Oopsacas minuta]